MKILVADKFPAAGLKALEALGATVIDAPNLKGSEFAACIKEQDPEVLIVRSREVREAEFDAAKSLSLIVRAGAGVNTIDVKRASESGIYVTNCPGKNALAVVELAFAHLFNLDRRIVDGALDLRAGVWNKKEYGKAEGLFGKRLGLIGLGQIGREMIPRAQAFGMQVFGWSRSLTPAQAEELSIEFCASPVALAKAVDIASVHVALTPDTRGFLGDEFFNSLPKNAYFINTSRGEVVDQEALERAVKGRGLRAGLDVFANEPKEGTGSLEPGIFALPLVYGSHHIGASTEQAQSAVADETIRIVQAYLQTGQVLNCVNLATQTEATHLLVLRHKDRVGVLARVLERLRGEGLNVQDMSNSLFAGGEAAVARIQLSSAPSDALLASLCSEDPDLLAVQLKAL